MKLEEQQRLSCLVNHEPAKPTKEEIKQLKKYRKEKLKETGSDLTPEELESIQGAGKNCLNIQCSICFLLLNLLFNTSMFDNQFLQGWKY